MRKPEILEDERFYVNWEVAEHHFHEAHVVHHVVHDVVKLLQVVLRSRLREGKYELVCELVKKLFIFTQVFDEVVVQMKRIWQVSSRSYALIHHYRGWRGTPCYSV